MALGGALRAAIKAADWVNVARESRRRARALADLNLRGGVRNADRARSPYTWLRQQGIDPYESIPAGGVRESPFGGRRIEMTAPIERTWATRPTLGGMPTTMPGRMSAPSFVGPSTTSVPMRSPIEAPYEGFRVMRGPVDEIGETFVQPGPWQGRGFGTQWDASPINGFDASDGSYFSTPFPAGFTSEPLRTFYPWRAFAQATTNFEPTPFAVGRRIPFNDIMNARGSLFRNRSEIPFYDYEIPF